MAENRFKPAIRFAGFTDAWEQHKLEEVVDVRSGKDYKHLSEGTIPVYATSGYMLSVNEALSYDEDAIGIGRKGTIDKPYLLKAPFWTVDTLFYAVPREKYDLNFAFDIFQNIDWKKKDESTGVPSLSKAAIKGIDILAPRYDEQKELGAYFARIDILITLHQRKHDKLVNMRKAMLGKMFPQDGISIPEIRFDGFTDAWKQRKLGELFTERNERGIDSLQILSVSIHHGVSSGELDSDALGKQVRRSEDKSIYKRVYFGDLVFNMMRAWQGAIGVVRIEGMVSPAYITAIPNEQVYPLFMDYCLRRNEIIAQMNNLSYGVTDFRKRLYWDSFVNVVCCIPSVPEQAKITAYFDHLDRLIALHQRELEKLQNLKRAFLEKMFV